MGISINWIKNMALKIAEHVTWKNLDMGIVLLDLNTGNYYTLNETASLICQNIIEGNELNRIVDSIIEEYDCDEETGRADVQNQILYFKKENLIIDD